MGKRYMTDAVDRSPRPLFAQGILLVQFEHGADVVGAEAKTYDIRMSIVKSPNPDDEGKSWFQRLFVGTAEDPQAEERATQARSRGLKLLALMCDKTGVDFDQEDEIFLAELEGKQFLARNTHRTTEKGAFNNLAWVYGVGERDVAAETEKRTRVLNGSGKPAAQRPAATAAPAFSGVQEIEE
jgi:hypothetical protein